MICEKFGLPRRSHGRHIGNGDVRILVLICNYRASGVKDSHYIYICMEYVPSWEIKVVQLVRKFPANYGTRRRRALSKIYGLKKDEVINSGYCIMRKCEFIQVTWYCWKSKMVKVTTGWVSVWNKGQGTEFRYGKLLGKQQLRRLRWRLEDDIMRSVMVIRDRLWGWQVDGTRSGLCPVADFGVSGVETKVQLSQGLFYVRSLLMPTFQP